LSKPPWLVRELELNEKLFPNHLPFIFYGALVGVGSLWPNCLIHHQIYKEVLKFFTKIDILKRKMLGRKNPKREEVKQPDHIIKIMNQYIRSEIVSGQQAPTPSKQG